MDHWRNDDTALRQTYDKQMRRTECAARVTWGCSRDKEAMEGAMNLSRAVDPGSAVMFPAMQCRCKYDVSAELELELVERLKI